MAGEVHKVLDAKKPTRCAGFSLVRRDREYSHRSTLARDLEEGRLTSEMPRPQMRAWFLRPYRPTQASLAVRPGRKKANAVRWLFTCAERPRFELGDQKYRSQLSRLLHYHSATSPKKAVTRAQRGRKFSEILSLRRREVEGVCILVHRCRLAHLKLNQSTTHEEVSFPRCICPVRIDSLCTIHPSAC